MLEFSFLKFSTDFETFYLGRQFCGTYLILRLNSSLLS